MGLFRRLAGILGFSREEGQEVHEENGDAGANLASPSAVAAAVAAAAQAQHLNRRGFSVPIQVQVDRPAPGPVLLPCTAGDGGVQVKVDRSIDPFLRKKEMSLFDVRFGCI